jgi:uncharacterized protein YqeY
MSLLEQLNEDLKRAMKAKDEVTKDTVRLIKAAVQNAEIEKQATLDDTSANELLARMARQYRESITMYRDNAREDLATKEEAELSIVLGYLPEQLGADEILTMAKAVADEVGAAGPGDKGKLMGKLMPQLRGKADGALVNKVVGELLDSLA